MAVKIRLKKTGRRKQASFRLVVVDSRGARDTQVIEELGSYNPHTEELMVDEGRTVEWLAKGAKPSRTAGQLLSKAGVQRGTSPDAA